MRVRRLDCEGNPIELPDEQRLVRGHMNSVRWVAPRTMPDWLVREVLAGRICGAPLERGGFCRRTKVLANADNQPPYLCSAHVERRRQKEERGSRRALSVPGFYAAGVMTDEEEIFASMDEDFISKLDDEIALAKIRLLRAAKAESAQLTTLLECTSDDLDDVLEKLTADQLLFEITRKSGQTVEGTIDLVDTKRKLIDWSPRIDKIFHHLARLTEAKLRWEGGGGMHPQERAAMAREAYNAMEAMDNDD